MLDDKNCKIYTVAKIFLFFFSVLTIELEISESVSLLINSVLDLKQTEFIKRMQT